MRGGWEYRMYVQRSRRKWMEVLAYLRFGLLRRDFDFSKEHGDIWILFFCIFLTQGSLEHGAD